MYGTQHCSRARGVPLLASAPYNTITRHPRRGGLRRAHGPWTRDHHPNRNRGTTRRTFMAIDPSTARRNRVLAGLDEESLAPLLPDLSEVPLSSGHVLHEV